MQSSKRPLEIDPDYELSDSTIKRMKIKEQQEKQDMLQKVTRIIGDHFATELSSRQSQIETIQERIVKVRKTMHLLRYVLVRSYYNSKNCVLNAAEEPACSSEAPLIDLQSRIHPALKKLIGKNASYPFSDIGRRRSKHKSETKTKSENASECAVSEPKEADSTEKCERVRVESKSVVVNGESGGCDTVRNRKKTKYRVVVGNISKYMPAKNKEDNSTHKWMMYVRGSKEEPNVSHFIKKVVFYLHPSYRPCDVIEIDKDPFHLSRRGWGEFPVRVQIFFHCTLNKPVDIIHNLKLDKTHTGRQTLGNETVVDLFLYDDKKLPAISPETIKTEIEIDENIPAIKQEEIILKDEPVTSDPSNEHDYYTSDTELPVDIDVKPESEVSDCVQLDHTYCLPQSSCDDTVDTNNLLHGISNEEQEDDKTTEEIICDFKSDFLINGNSVLKNTSIKQLIPQLLSKDTHLKILKIMDKDGKTVIINKSNNLDVQNTVPDRNKYSINIPVANFKNVLEVLPFLFRRLPLVTNLADDVSYKCRYPYVADSLDEYFSWNIGKRLSSEWRRAKTVLEYLHSTKIVGFEKWNTKLLIMYARAHAYTPFCTYSLLENNFALKSLLTSYEVTNNAPKKALMLEPNVPINITEVENDAPEFKLSKSGFLNKTCKIECLFVRKVALDSRVKLQPEEIAPGVLCNAAEVMILESVKCLVNDLVRNARTHSVFDGNFCEETSVIGVKDVMAAIRDRAEFEKIIESCRNKSQMEYYS